MQSTSRVEGFNGVLKKDLDGRCISLCDLHITIARLLKERQNNNEFVAWKTLMLIISPPNIYNTIFQEIDKELCTYITFAITEKIWEQMNYSFLYYATQIEFNNLAQNNLDLDVLYETSCVNEVFDLPQTCINMILLKFRGQISSIWEVRHMKYATPSQFICLLTNGDHRCTCKLSIISGWICRHFFR
ncbi:518_t:CDS:1, partial [Cetraspora pellucida]